MVRVKRSTWGLQGVSVDTSCCLLSLRINIFTPGLQLIQSKDLLLLIPVKEVAGNLVYGRLPSWRGQEVWGEVLPLYVAHLLLFRQWMLTDKDVGNKEGEEQSCSSFQSGRSSCEIWKVWTGTPLGRDLRTHSVIYLGACNLSFLLNSPLLLLFFLLFFRQAHNSPCLC